MTEELYPYGIQTEKSDIRAHVAVAAKRVLVFKTQDILTLIKFNYFEEAYASQDGIEGPTAKGLKIPVSKIPDLRVLHFESYPWNYFPPKDSDTSTKGAAAVEVVQAALEIGRFPLWIESKEESGKDSQIEGTDIIVNAKIRIQVKCDWFAGLKAWHPECTGNIYLQTAERNYLKRL